MRTNSVQLIGYLGNHLVVKTFPNGDKKVNLRVATHHPIKGNDGQTKYVTTWHDVVAWNHTATIAENNFVKGSRLLVDGHIIYRTYSDKLGHARYLTEIKAISLQNLDR